MNLICGTEIKDCLNRLQKDIAFMQMQLAESDEEFKQQTDLFLGFSSPPVAAVETPAKNTGH